MLDDVAIHSDILVMLKTFVLQLKRRSSEYAKTKRCSISMPDNAEGQKTKPSEI